MRLPILFLLFTVTLDAIGIGIIMPVMPDLIIELGGGSLSQAAMWGGAMASIFAVMQFLFGPTLGSLSDRYGRRPVLLVSLVAMSIDYLIMGFASAMWMLVAGRIIGGITSATQATANAYMADISKPNEKAQNFGMIGAAFGVGFIIGPLLGGVLSEFGSRMPFFFAAGLAAANAIFGYFILKETVTDKIRRPFTLARANPFGAFAYIAKLPGLKRLMTVFFFYNIAFFVYPSIWAYFTQLRFGWDAQMVGVSLAAFGLSMAIVQGGLMRFIVPRLGEHMTVIVGFSVTVFAFLLYANTNAGWQIFALAPITSLGVLAGPALQGIMSRTADDNQQGELQGVLTSVSSVGVIISPLIMTNVFAYFTEEGAPIYAPGAPFYLSAALVLMSLVIFSGRKRLYSYGN